MASRDRNHIPNLSVNTSFTSPEQGYFHDPFVQLPHQYRTSHRGGQLGELILVNTPPDTCHGAPPCAPCLRTIELPTLPEDDPANNTLDQPSQELPIQYAPAEVPDAAIFPALRGIGIYNNTQTSPEDDGAYGNQLADNFAQYALQAGQVEEDDPTATVINDQFQFKIDFVSSTNVLDLTIFPPPAASATRRRRKNKSHLREIFLLKNRPRMA